MIRSKAQKKAEKKAEREARDAAGKFRQWTFNDWIVINGAPRNVIKEWLDGLPAEDKQAITTRLLTMRNMRIWPDYWASDYVGYSGILELRMNFNDTPYRPLACYGPGPKNWQFTILVGAIEVNGKIDKHLLKTAMDRKKNLTVRCVCEHDYT